MDIFDVNMKDPGHRNSPNSANIDPRNAELMIGCH
jgi:hypothetical protein